VTLCVLLAFAAAALAAGCGGSSSKSSSTPTTFTSSARDFPSAQGRTLGQIIHGLPTGPVLAPSMSVVTAGVNRFGFALFSVDRKQIVGPPVALYLGSASGANARGPFPVRQESLAVAPPFQSQTVASDPFAAKSVNVAYVPFSTAKIQAVVALLRINGKLEASNAEGVQLSNVAATPPAVGQRAIVIHTPTTASVGGNVSLIDTRTPPDDMHKVDFAKVVGHRPVILLFATPQLCQSRVCGPVVDLVAQLEAKYGRQADFIHMEIYNGNQVSKGYRPQVAAYRLPTEPWMFAIDRHGVIVARIEGAFSADELEQAVQKAIAS